MLLEQESNQGQDPNFVSGIQLEEPDSMSSFQPLAATELITQYGLTISAFYRHLGQVQKQFPNEIQKRGTHFYVTALGEELIQVLRCLK